MIACIGSQTRVNDWAQAGLGTVGDALDNVLMESQIGLCRTELIRPRKPWHALADVELATAEWVDWFNNQRLHTAIGDIPHPQMRCGRRVCRRRRKTSFSASVRRPSTGIALDAASIDHCCGEIVAAGTSWPQWVR